MQLVIGVPGTILTRDSTLSGASHDGPEHCDTPWVTRGRVSIGC